MTAHTQYQLCHSSVEGAVGVFGSFARLVGTALHFSGEEPLPPLPWGMVNNMRVFALDPLMAHEVAVANTGPCVVSGTLSATTD